MIQWDGHCVTWWTIQGFRPWSDSPSHLFSRAQTVIGEEMYGDCKRWKREKMQAAALYSYSSGIPIFTWGIPKAFFTTAFLGSWCWTQGNDWLTATCYVLAKKGDICKTEHKATTFEWWQAYHVNVDKNDHVHWTPLLNCWARPPGNGPLSTVGSLYSMYATTSYF